jgi:hypothetical protein
MKIKKMLYALYNTIMLVSIVSNIGYWLCYIFIPMDLKPRMVYNFELREFVWYKPETPNFVNYYGWFIALTIILIFIAFYTELKMFKKIER